MKQKKQSVVLFVDDEPALLDGIRNALRKEPYEILTASSASEGLKALHEHGVDVVVSDERMPGVSGAEFLAFVRQRFPDTVRIMLTGQASLEAAIQAINEGEVFRFLTKPCSPLLLAQTLRDALLLQGLKREGRRLLSAVRRQRSLLEELELEHPGLTDVRRERDGSVVLKDEFDTADLLQQMRAEADRVSGAAA